MPDANDTLNTKGLSGPGSRSRAASPKQVSIGYLNLVVPAAAVIGVVLSALAAFEVLLEIRETRRAEIDAKLGDLAGRVETQMKADLGSLSALQGYMTVQTGQRSEAFAEIASRLVETDSSIIAYGWAPRVNAIDEASHILGMLRAGYIGYTIQRLEGAHALPDGQGPRFPIQFMEPELGMTAFRGIDLKSSALIRRSLEYAVDFNEYAFSDPLSDIVATPLSEQMRDSVIGFAPVYERDARTYLVKQRQENIAGVVFGVFNPGNIVQSGLFESDLDALLTDPAIGLQVSWVREAADTAPLFESRNFQRLLQVPENLVLRPIYRDTLSFNVGELPLRLQIVSDLSATTQVSLLIPATVFGVGLLITIMLCSLLWFLINRERTVQQTVNERTRALSMSEQRAHNMADVAADWFWSTDHHHRFNWFSDRFGQVTGVDPGLLLGRTRLETVGRDTNNLDEMWIDHLLDLENRREFHDFKYVRKDDGGEDVYFSISGKPVYDPEGRYLGYMGSGRNITEEESTKNTIRENETRLRHYIEELEVSRQYLEQNTNEMAKMAEQYAIEKERAEASEKSKSEFLASMSHEIRTPMAGVMGFADMLLDGELSQEDREKVLKIKGATQSLLTIINDILDISKLEAGRLEIESIDFNLRKSVEDTLELVADRASSKGLALKTRFSDDLPLGVKGDPTRLRQILINLVGNAVKFTDEGSVTVSMRTIDGEGGAYIYVAVSDTGIGIREDAREHLFQDFFQADATISRRYEGTGLGLAISRRLSELMGGQIGVDSTEGVGSTFWFTFKFVEATSDVTVAAPEQQIRSFKTRRQLHILVAEDNKLNQRIIAATLEGFHHTYHIVDNGAKAVDAVGEGNFDLILMDVRMPEMSGPDATKVIRARGDDLASIPIIAVTADAMQEHIQSYLQDGMNACVTKPIDRAEMAITINDVLGEEIHTPIYEKAPASDDSLGRLSSPNAPNVDANLADFLSNLKSVADEIGSKSKAQS